MTSFPAFSSSSSGSARPVFKIDRFSVPEAAVEDFSRRLRQIQQVLSEQPGCRQNLVLEGLGNAQDGRRDVATVVEWESEDAFAAARAAVRKRYAAEGFDPAAFMRRLNVAASMGEFRAVNV